jgi:hypothetical protein
VQVGVKVNVRFSAPVFVTVKSCVFDVPAALVTLDPPCATTVTPGAAALIVCVPVTLRPALVALRLTVPLVPFAPAVYCTVTLEEAPAEMGPTLAGPLHAVTVGVHVVVSVYVALVLLVLVTAKIEFFTSPAGW